MTDMVANVTNILSLANKNSGLVMTLATRFPYDLDLNYKSKGETNFFSYLNFEPCKPNYHCVIHKISLPSS